MALSGAQVQAGRALLPFNKRLGAYMIIDGASAWMGSVESMSRSLYGDETDIWLINDFVGDAYRSGAKLVAVDEAYGDMARAGVGIFSTYKAWKTVILKDYNVNKAYQSRLLRGDGSVYPKGSLLSYTMKEQAFKSWAYADFTLETLGIANTARGIADNLMPLSDDIMGGVVVGAPGLSSQ